MSRQGIHWQIERAVLKALEKDPADRYESARAFAEALEEAVRVWQKETGEEKSLEALGGMAVRAMDEGKWGEAVECWRKYLALAPGSTLATSNLATAERELRLEQLRDAIEQKEAAGDWDGAIAALESLLTMLPRDEPTQQRLENARKQKTARHLYNQARGALDQDNLDDAIMYARQATELVPGHREAADLLRLTLNRKVGELKDEALLAMSNGNTRLALEKVRQIRSLDPDYRFLRKQTVDEIENAAHKANKRRRYIAGAGCLVAGVGIAAIALFLVFGPLRRFIWPGGSAAPAPAPTLAAVPTSGGLALAETPAGSPAAGPTATPTPLPTATPSPAPQTPTPTDTPIPTATSAPVPAPTADAVVKSGGAPLRPGASTWWRVRETLPAGTLLDLLGYDPAFPDWVYVRTVDGRSTGWTQTANLEIHVNLNGLPRITPIPTLTPTPRTSAPPPASCAGGPLKLDAWVVNKVCTSSGWTATIFAQGHGGDCMYTYYWERGVRGGPTSGSMTFEVSSAGYGNAIVGEVSVMSAGQTVVVGLYIEPPSCGGP